jgi:hypothetical protein
MNEIERKFLITEVPDVPILGRYLSERYLLDSEKGAEERITHTGNKYYYEQKQVISD